MATWPRTFWFALLIPATSASAAGLPDTCGTTPLPFASIEVKHPIDSSCGLLGKPAASAASQRQNSVKNNFCAGVGVATPEPITLASLVTLQGQTTVPSGFGKEPSSRAALKSLGEGKYVRMKAFLYEAHFADLGSGESVNCQEKTSVGNDIHIALIGSATGEECASVTAEITPHYRPDSWSVIGTDETYSSSTKKYTPDPVMEAKLKGREFRFTGQLFFDASHTVCGCASTCNPNRSSGWEIHPVYAIDVCKAGTGCDAADDSQWQSFDAWWAGNPAPSSTPPPKRKPHRHPNHEAKPPKHAHS